MAGGALVNYVYARLSGRNWLQDAATRLRLASRSLESWERAHARRARRSPIVVCLTTTPSRAPQLTATLKSLFAQSVAPRTIRLHLPTWSRRENRAYEIPPWLESLSSIEIVRCEDCGPATKLMPALRDLDPDQLLLVVDDDMLYPPTLVADMEEAAGRLPGHAICSSGWIVPADLADRPTTLRSHLTQTPPAPLLATLVRTPVAVDIMQGFSGYLVRPRFFDAEVITTHAQAPPAAFFVDDVWFSAHCRVPKIVRPARRFCFDRWRSQRFFKANSLGVLNRGNGDVTQRNNTLMIRHFAQRWLVSPQLAAAPPPTES